MIIKVELLTYKLFNSNKNNVPADVQIRYIQSRVNKYITREVFFLLLNILKSGRTVRLEDDSKGLEIPPHTFVSSKCIVDPTSSPHLGWEFVDRLFMQL